MKRSPPVTLNLFQGPSLHPPRASPQWMLKQVQHNGERDDA